MDIVIIAANEEQIQELVKQVTVTTVDANIETFVDPFFALKYLFSHKADLVFVKDRIKTIAAGQVVNLLRRKCKGIDITVIADDRTLEKQVLETGADRLITGTITKEVLGGIVKEVEAFKDE